MVFCDVSGLFFPHCQQKDPFSPYSLYDGNHGTVYGFSFHKREKSAGWKSKSKCHTRIDYISLCDLSTSRFLQVVVFVGETLTHNCQTQY